MSGTYVCVASNVAGTAENSAVVTVVGELTLCFFVLLELSHSTFALFFFVLH
jgi:hypothetical protein